MEWSALQEMTAIVERRSHGMRARQIERERERRRDAEMDEVYYLDDKTRQERVQHQLAGFKAPVRSIASAELDLLC